MTSCGLLCKNCKLLKVCDIRDLISEDVKKKKFENIFSIFFFIIFLHVHSVVCGYINIAMCAHFSSRSLCVARFSS